MTQASNLIIGLLMISLVLVGGSMYYTDIASQYGANSTEDISSLNQTSELTSKIQNMETQLSSKTLTGTPLDAPAMILTGGWEALKILLEIPNVMSNIISEFMFRLKIPKAMETIILMIATVVTIFIVVTLIFKVKA